MASASVGVWAEEMDERRGSRSVGQRRSSREEERIQGADIDDREKLSEMARDESVKEDPVLRLKTKREGRVSSANRERAGGTRWFVAGSPLSLPSPDKYVPSYSRGTAKRRRKVSGRCL